MRDSVLSGWEEQALQEIDQEIDNIRLFWYMVIKKGDFENLGCTSFILHHYYLRRNLFEEGAHMFQAAVDQVWDDSDEVIQLIRARLKNFLAEFLWNMGKYDGALSLIEEASKTTNELQIDARWDIAFSKYMLGQINPNLDQKTRLHRESLEIFIRIPDAYRQATELAILGRVMHNSGQFIQAEEYTRQSLSIFKHLNNPYPLARTTGILGFQMLLMGDLDQAQHYLNESIDIADECHASDLIVVGMNWLSQAYLLQGKFMQAEERIKNSLEGAKRIGFVHFIIHSTNISGLIKLFRGRYQDARNLFTLALDQVLRIGRKDYEGLSKMLIAAAAIAQQEVSFALTLIDDSVEIFRDLSRADSLAEALLFAGLIYTHAGNIEGGSKLLREGWKMLSDLHQYHIYLTGLSAAALYFVKIGENNKAVEIYSLASNQPLVAVSPWYERMVGDYIKLASGEISQEELNNALKRGRALSIWGAPEILLDWLP
jgi:tetratricopeptide (TPR) repeat protein